MKESFTTGKEPTSGPTLVMIWSRLVRKKADAAKKRPVNWKSIVQSWKAAKSGGGLEHPVFICTPTASLVCSVGPNVCSRVKYEA